MIVLKIYKGDPSAEDWAKIGKMIAEGYNTGIDQPPGINWEVSWSPGSNLKSTKRNK